MDKKRGAISIDAVTRTFEGQFTEVNIKIYDLSENLVDTLVLEEGLHNQEYYNSDLE